MRRKPVALIAAALLALAGLTTASAAGLNLSSAGMAAIGNGSHASLPASNVTIPISNTYGGLFGGTHAFALTINGWHVPVQVN